jgi:hypothetical protein
MNPFAKLLTIAALCFLALIYGAVSVHMRWWPSQIVADAGRAAKALLSAGEEEFKKNWPTSMEMLVADERSLITINHVTEERLSDDLFFVDGGSQQLRSHCPDNGCIAWIMDRAGDVKHVWSIGPDLIWDDLQNVEGFSRGANIYSVGAHPFANGDLLVTYQGRNTYPYGVGMAKFDKDSKLLWKKENFAHHWFTVGPEGRIYVPAFDAVAAPYELGETNLQIGCDGGTLQEDVILVLDPDGNELERISLLEALADSDYNGIGFQAIHSDRGLPLSYNECDPNHLNDVRYISAERAATSPHLEAGDLLVSLRSNNSVLTINSESRQIGWVSTGRTVLQHSPRYMDDNSVLVFDNLGGIQAQGGSRLVRIDMDTQEAQVVYPRKDDNGVTEVLTYNGGHIGLSDDGSRALMSLTRQGRTLEIDLATGELLWEFQNTHDVGDLVADPDGRSHARFATQTVLYFNGADFEFNGGRL